MRGVSHRTLGIGTVAAAVLVGVAPGAAAKTATRGVVWGGVTSQGWPVVVELRKKRREIVRAAIGLHLQCTSGSIANVPDTYRDVRVSKKGKFSASFGPETVRRDDGTTFDVEGSVSGALNSTRTKLSGKWQIKLTDHDAAGVVTDTCDSGAVSWTAKQ